MYHYSYLVAALFVGISLGSPTLAAESSATATGENSRLNHLKQFTQGQVSQLKVATQDQIKILKVDANAAQPDSQKDPFQSINRQIYRFNNSIDDQLLRPVAVQYAKKTPEQLRGSFTQARRNLGEPWNAVNQLVQGRPLRAAKTLGRFAINTTTTLGFADPARRLGLNTEDENFGTTLGFYGVPSGPYLVIPFLGPSTLRDSLGLFVDARTRVQNYVFNDQDGLYWGERTWLIVDTRARLLDLEDVLQGDRYAAIRDIYLQRKTFQIAEKQGLSAENIGFIDDEFELDLESESENPQIDE